MKYIFAALLCAAVLVSACNAACGFYPPQKVEEGGKPKGCLYKGEWHDLGSRFKKDCLVCSCYDNGSMQCCSDFQCEEQSGRDSDN